MEIRWGTTKVYPKKNAWNGQYLYLFKLCNKVIQVNLRDSPLPKPEIHVQQIRSKRERNYFEKYWNETNLLNSLVEKKTQNDPLQQTRGKLVFLEV